jgi:hypothetical protein
MERKAERLVLILEGVALLTALILILVDYKLKNDLVELYGKMEAALERGQKLFGQDANTGSDSLRVRSGDLVGNVSPLETSANTGATSQNGQPTAANRRAPAKRSGRAGNKEIPHTDKQMGP